MRPYLPLFALLLCPIPAPAADTPFDQIVAAERAFAADAAARGVKAAFVAAFADDSLVYTPDGPADGRALYAARPESPLAIAWGPEAAEVAASGDLGYTYGPAEYSSIDDPKAPHRYGHYFSIWERGSDGVFKVVHDVGASHGEAAQATTATRRGPAAPAAAPAVLANRERNTRLQALVAADRLREDGGLKAVPLAPDAVVFRDGQLPGPASAQVDAAPAGERSATALGSIRLSAAGDLASTVGGTGAGAKAPRAYQRVWRWDGSRWLLVVDQE